MESGLTAPDALPPVSRALWFTSARNAEILEQPLKPPTGTEVTVRALVSLVSAGTEMLVYRGDLPAEDDLGLETCEGNFGFPVKYGYQVVGEVIAAGERAVHEPGEIVFARHPHQDYFTMRSDNWLMSGIPEGLAPERAVFVNLVEVALNCHLDVPVRHGDRVAVFGQGIVGSLCAQLTRRTAGVVVVVDPIEARRQAALAWGADAAVDPAEAAAAVAEHTGGQGADIVIEATGTPSALQAAIEATGQEGTVVTLSYFGKRPVELKLAPEFHYGRQKIVSSQVSSLGAGLQPRWDRQRRNAVAFRLLADPSLVTLVSRHMPLSQAPEAYRILDSPSLEDAMGILLRYGDGG